MDVSLIDVPARARRRVGTGGRIGAMRRRARRRARSALICAFACASACAFARAESSFASVRMDDGIQHHGGDVSEVTTATATWDDRARGDAKDASSTMRESSVGDAMARKWREGSRRDDFEAFVERGDKRREYCGNEGAYPCDESRRREKIFYENAEVALALDRTALLGRRHSRKHRPEDEEDEEDAYEEDEDELSDSRVKYGTTIWSDRTREEFESSTGSLTPTPASERDRSREKKESWKRMHEEFLKRNADIWTHGRNTDGDLFDSEHVPKSWDWREIGGLSKVWEQGACGGCWAFTTVAAVEGVHYIWTKEEVSLSPQMLLECDPIDQDCTGGNMVTGYQYAVMKGGISSANDYPVHPYTLKTSEVGPCRTNTARKHAASIDDYIVLENSWSELKSAIYMQPVSVAVNALGERFRFYSGGVLTYDDCQPDWDNSPNLINHAVVAVGFGYDKHLDLEYVVIKNSWGPQWGENGFARIAMQGGEMNATCGLLIESVAPLKLSNLTYSDPDYVAGFNDYVDWAPKSQLSDVNGILYVILTTFALVGALSMGIITIVSCMTEDDGYYYTDLNFDEYDEKFDVRKHAFGREDRLQGLSVTQKLSRFQARREPVTGLPARGRSGRDPRDMSDVKPHRGGDRL